MIRLNTLINLPRTVKKPGGFASRLGLLLLGLVLVAGCSQQAAGPVPTVTYPAVPAAGSSPSLSVAKITGQCSRDELLTFLRSSSSQTQEFVDVVSKSTNFAPKQITPALQRMTDLNTAFNALKVPDCAKGHAKTITTMFAMAITAYTQFSTGSGLNVDLAKTASDVKAEYALASAEETQLVDFYNKLPVQ